MGVTIALRGMNQQMKLPQVKRILMEFEKQLQMMDLKEEMLNEAMDSSMGMEDPDAESDELVTQVLDELGLQLQHQLPELPGSQHGHKKEVPADVPENGFDDELQARLNNLRRN